MPDGHETITVPTARLAELLDAVAVLRHAADGGITLVRDLGQALARAHRLELTMRLAISDATETGPSEVFDSADRLRLVASALRCEAAFDRDPHVVVEAANRATTRLRMFERFVAVLHTELGAEYPAVKRWLDALREVDRG